MFHKEALTFALVAFPEGRHLNPARLSLPPTNQFNNSLTSSHPVSLGWGGQGSEAPSDMKKCSCQQPMTMVTGMCRAHPHLYRAAFKEITTCSKGQGGACSGPRPECRLVRGVDSPAPAITQALKTTTLAAPTWQHPHIPYLAPWPSSFCVARKERQRETLWGFTLPETKKKKGPKYGGEEARED